MHVPLLSRPFCFVLAALMLALPRVALHAQTPGHYTFTKILDGSTAVPGEIGTTFADLNNTTNQIIVIDGDTVAFTLLEFPAGGVSPSSYSAWSTSTSGGTPRRLADTTMPVPGGNLGLFNEIEVRGIGGGMVVFQAEFTGGVGLYAVPENGGTIITLVDTNTPMPSSTVNFGFEQDIQSVAVHGSQILFAADDGYYFVPVTGGAIVRFGDGTTPVVDSLGNKYFPNDFAGVGGSQQADFGGGTVAFLPTYTNDFSELFTGPITGLIDGSDGIADNAAFIAGTNTPVPDGSGAGFDAQSFDALVDDSGTTVFYGSASDGSSYGLFAAINGVIATLADSHTVAVGQTNPLSSIYGGQKAVTVSGGQVYFDATVTTNGGDGVQGVFTVPVYGGPVVPVVTNSDTLPGADGGQFGGVQSFFGAVSNGRLVFYGGVHDASAGTSAAGIFLATPTGTTQPTANPLVLSTHTGGNVGPVTVTATIVPGEPALVSGATVKLASSGVADIAGGSVVVNAAGTSLTTIIDLNAQAIATYDFVITNPDGTVYTQPATFTVEAATGPDVYADILGRDSLRAGKAQPYTVIVGNRGDVDAAMVPVFVNFPSYFTCQLVTPLAALPQPANFSTTLDYSQIPLTYVNGDHNVLALIVPRIAAGGFATIQVLFSCPDSPQYAHVPFTCNVAAGEPWIDAETGMVLAGTSLPGTDAKHRDAVGLQSTCLAGYFNLVVDCVSAIFPELAIIECGPNVILAAENIYAGLASDNATQATTVISYTQAGATFTATLLGCLGKVSPGVGTIINVVQCGLDTYSLFENCFKPAIMFYGSTIVSGDPNDLDGSQGDGSAAHYLTGAVPLRYAVYFENDDTASAPAQNVTITNPLDANLDLSTFSLGPISFGSTLLNPPSGSQNYSTVVDLRPATNLLVQITAALNTASRTLSYAFVSLDPATNQPPTDPNAGFLPPDITPPAGDGFAIYYARPKAGLSTGTVISDQASIVFDVNAAIATPIWTNTIDNDAPASQVTALPAKEKSADIPLLLNGTDNGSGVSYYNVYVSEDGGTFAPLVKHAPGPGVTYSGVTGHTYAFFSQAVDGAGNVEPLKTAAETKTKIKGADLVGSWTGTIVATTTASGRTKLKLKGDFTVKNQSPQKATAAGSVVRLFLSTDANFDAGDLVIGQDVPFGVLAPGASVNLALGSLKLPAGTAASGMYVIAVINPDHVVKETDYTNNAVTYGPLP